jgi:hypothetical protein
MSACRRQKWRITTSSILRACSDEPGALETSPVSPGGRYFLHTFSTVDTVPVTVLRSTRDGRVIAAVDGPMQA